MTMTQTIVPANRLGQLLAENRLRVGADLESIANRSQFTVGELADIEAGHFVLSDELIAQVTKIYSVDTGAVIPQRAELVVDLGRQQISASGQSVQLSASTNDHILDRYLSLVYVLRNKLPGTEIPLRDKDLGILSNSLAMDRALIVQSLQDSMESNAEPVRGLVAWFKNRMWVPRAGILVGAVSVGSLVMLTSNPAAATDMIDVPEPEPEPEPEATNIVVETTQRVTIVETEVPEDPVPEQIVTPAKGDLEVAAVDVNAMSAKTSAEARQSDTTEQSVQVSREELGRQAEALIAFDLERNLPDWEINYLGPKPGHRGLTFPYEQRIDIYVRDTDTAQSLAAIVAHEVGHAVDTHMLTDSDRWDWLHARSIADAPWWPTAYDADFSSGAGDFAEAFAYMTTGNASQSEIGGQLTTKQLSVLQGIVNRAVR